MRFVDFFSCFSIFNRYIYAREANVALYALGIALI